MQICTRGGFILHEIYLDNAATTRVSESAAQLALDIMREDYGNPSSLHSKGFKAMQAVKLARSQIAGALGCWPDEITFTSGGTEANNLAILGAAARHHRGGKTIITTAVEHSSVLEPICQLEKQGYTINIIQPGSDGSVDINEVAAAVNDDTLLVSCMMVNSETGAVNDIAGLARLVKRKNPSVLVHCDAVQGFGKIAFTMRQIPVDMLTVSSHKIHAPKGAGALFIRKGVRISPLMFGGGQEGSLRPGTESTPLICAFGHMAQELNTQRGENLAKMNELAAYFRERAAGISKICINSPQNGTPYIHNISVPGRRSQPMLNALAEHGVYVSSGSACSKGKLSHVLLAMGLPRERVDSALRVSLCRDTTTNELDKFFELLEAVTTQLAGTK